jgi:hypothetical protein
MSDLVTRREAIARAAYILGGVISAPTLAGVLAGCERRAPEAASAAKALSSDQKELIATLSDHIIPPTDTPGASAAGVQDFMDVMMAEYYPPEERTRFVNGLARVDERSKKAYGKPFTQLPQDQQLEVVKAFNRQAFQNRAARQTETVQEPVMRETDTETGRSDAEALKTKSSAVMLDRDWDPEDVGRQAFFRTFKELVVVGYYTSKPGATEELRYPPMGSWHGDIPYARVGRSWA